MSVRPFRVITINTGKCDGPYRARLEALVTALAALEPDLVLAQEVFEGVAGGPAAALSTARSLAGGLGMAIVFHPARRKPRVVEGVAGDSYSGLATLSRWPIRDVTWRALPDDPDDGDRAVLFVALDAPGGAVRSANTHLTHLRHRDDLRVRQARQLVGDPWWDAAPGVRILGGDMNARPDHEVHAVFRGEGAGGPAGADVFALAGDAQPAPTVRRQTADGTVEARLDYLYLVAAAGTQPAVVRASVVLDEPVGDVLPSDHFGVMADVALGSASSRK